jgi:hypothetical protein
VSPPAIALIILAAFGCVMLWTWIVHTAGYDMGHRHGRSRAEMELRHALEERNEARAKAETWERRANVALRAVSEPERKHSPDMADVSAPTPAVQSWAHDGPQTIVIEHVMRMTHELYNRTGQHIVKGLIIHEEHGPRIGMIPGSRITLSVGSGDVELHCESSKTWWQV